MSSIVGEPKFLQECEPGDLVRVAHRADSRFAIAVSTRPEVFPDRILLLDEADGFPVIGIGGAEPVISYGKGYKIREGMAQDAISGAMSSVPGSIELRMWQGCKATHLIGKSDRYHIGIDLETGCLSGQFAGSGFNITRWSLHLLRTDGFDPIEVFHTAGTTT